MPDYSSKYFTTRSLASNNTISFTVKARLTTSYATSISYSTDSGTTWNTTTINGTDKTISVSNLGNGDEVWWKGIATSWVVSGSTTADYMNTSNFGATGNYEIEGNIMSLLHGDDFQDKFTLTGENNFAFLFYASTTLKNAYNLVLPATTLTDRCYRSLLQACSGLVTPMRELPAMTLTTSCYQGMFDSDSAMTSGPKLPATTLASNCYNNMFLRCRALTSSPVLPAKTLVTDCYRAMFNTCVSLKHIICLATSGLGTSTCNGWVTSVPTDSSGLFEYASGASWSRGTSGIPTGWKTSIYDPLSVDVDTITAPASGSAYTINLTSQNPWTATTAQQWITVSPSTGNGDTALTVTISANGSLQRSGSITITDSNSNSVTITVYQERASISLKSCSLARSGNVVNRMYREGQLILLNVAHKPYLDISEDDIDFEKEASSTTITVDSNVIWTASTSTPWITITTGASALNVAVSENTTGEDREGTITISGRNMLGTVSTSITVNQAYVIDYTTRYLTTRSLANNNTITFIKATALTPTSATSMSYSTDNGQTWNTMTVGNGAQSLSVTLNSGETAIWKGICTSWISGGTGGTYSSYIHASGDFEVEGNMLSLCYGDDFQNYTGIGRRQLRTMFWSATTLVNAENLVIPITSVKADGAGGTFALESMFYGCSNLVKGPKEIPMISGTLPSGVFAQWFYGCSKLTSAPPLNYTSLVQRHYYYMFYGCSSLKSITCLATSGINSIESTYNWVSGINASGTFYKKRGASWPTGNSGIPSGWTVVEVD